MFSCDGEQRQEISFLLSLLIRVPISSMKALHSWLNYLNTLILGIRVSNEFEGDTNIQSIKARGAVEKPDWDQKQRWAGAILSRMVKVGLMSSWCLSKGRQLMKIFVMHVNKGKSILGRGNSSPKTWKWELTLGFWSVVCVVEEQWRECLAGPWDEVEWWRWGGEKERQP